MRSNLTYLSIRMMGSLYKFLVVSNNLAIFKYFQNKKIIKNIHIPLTLLY